MREYSDAIQNNQREIILINYSLEQKFSSKITLFQNNTKIGFYVPREYIIVNKTKFTFSKKFRLFNSQYEVFNKSGDKICGLSDISIGHQISTANLNFTNGGEYKVERVSNDFFQNGKGAIFLSDNNGLKAELIEENLEWFPINIKNSGKINLYTNEKVLLENDIVLLAVLLISKEVLRPGSD